MLGIRLFQNVNHLLTCHACHPCKRLKSKKVLGNESLLSMIRWEVRTFCRSPKGTFTKCNLWGRRSKMYVLSIGNNHAFVTRLFVWLCEYVKMGDTQNLLYENNPKVFCNDIMAGFQNSPRIPRTLHFKTIPASPALPAFSKIFPAFSAT